ncbi:MULTISPECIES: hypothetical protein [Sulfurimonas]|uniref:Rod shape-determining protein MreD n=1 Tax=Sulfurimonas diazotrophicus TaxID=3131939 RepID=A0ABZ3HCS7_9BACT
MQRNRADQNPLIWLFFALLFVPYEALSMHYLYLPPMFGVLFFLYIRALDTHSSFAFFLILILLVIAETAKGYLLLSTLFFYTVSYFLILPRIKSIVSCHLCLNAIIVVLAYVGYWAFTALFANMFALPLPQLDFKVIFYMMIEFFLVGLL